MHFSFVTIALTIAATAAPALAVPVRLVTFPQGPGLQAAPTTPHVGNGQPFDLNHLKYDAVHSKSRRASTLHTESFAPVDTDATTVHRTPGIMPPWLLNRLRQTAVAQPNARREFSPSIDGFPQRWRGLPNFRIGTVVRPTAQQNARRAATPIVDSPASDTTVDTKWNSPPLVGSDASSRWRSPPLVGSDASSRWRSPPFTRPRIGTTVLKNGGSAASNQNGYVPAANERRDAVRLSAFNPNRFRIGTPRIGTVILPKDDAPVRRSDFADALMKRLLTDAMEAL